MNMSTPHARGSTGSKTAMFLPSYVYPACAGIHPAKEEQNMRYWRLPRMRGDPPFLERGSKGAELSTPHARGSTHALIKQRTGKKVYPACAGIHPPATRPRLGLVCLPRMRGDPPRLQTLAEAYHGSTPHARGSTRDRSRRRRRQAVYPACAGIHLIIA